MNALRILRRAMVLFHGDANYVCWQGWWSHGTRFLPRCSRIRQGDGSARSRLVEMYLRSALLVGLRWSKTLDVDLQDAVGDACEGLVKAANSYNPDKVSKFSDYCMRGMYASVTRGQPVHNHHITFIKYDLDDVHKTYVLLKKRGCLGCDRFVCCGRVMRQIAGILNCDPEESRMIVLTFVEPLSLETYLETVSRGGCDGQCEDIGPEEDDAPVYETELSAYFTDPSAVAEERLARLGLGRKLQEQLWNLSDREREVLEYHYGIRGGKTHTFEEIASMYGVTRSRIQQNEVAAIKNLRIRGRGLLEYLSDKQTDRGKNMKPEKTQVRAICRKEGLEKEQSDRRIGRG